MNIFQDWDANKRNPKGRFILILFRIASACAQLHPKYRWLAFPYVAFYRILVEWIFGIELPWKLTLGSHTMLFHGQGTVINDRSIIGGNCVIRHNTTIGVSVTDSSYHGLAPVIEDFVDIGSNAVIIGNIKIGHHARIGAGSVVVKDVPPGATVVGNPARVIRTLTDTGVGNE